MAGGRPERVGHPDGQPCNPGWDAIVALLEKLALKNVTANAIRAPEGRQQAANDAQGTGLPDT
ncbi:hypothetical protein [Castellaniella sp.]|uniref:hypothetical protein n=1 Tax=Castellaniella sp. TaxID=1955812 RepID=UPI002AFEAEF7|nr:hypothetical protein [Castellaniella sp.]